MNIYIFPTELEAEPFRRLSPDSVVVISGVGMAAMAATITSIAYSGGIDDDECLVLCGIAGSYAGDIDVGDVVEVVEECCMELPERFRRVYRQPSPLTSLRKVVSNSVDGCCSNGANVEIENMEGATLFAIAEVLNFRFAEVRAISNRVGDPFDRWNIELATQRLAEELLRL